MPVEPLERLRAVLRYQFGEAAEKLLRKERLEVVLSKRTGKIREVRAAGKSFISIRAKDGYATLSMEAAKELLTALKGRYLVTASGGVASFIAQGRNLFAKHVVSADANIRPGEEVLVVNEDGRLLATGRALLSGEEMLEYNKGVAVKVRRGAGNAKT